MYQAKTWRTLEKERKEQEYLSRPQLESRQLSAGLALSIFLVGAVLKACGII